MLIFKDSLIPINLQAVESLKKNILKYMIVFGVESFGKEVYFIATTGGANIKQYNRKPTKEVKNQYENS